jgi:hypothetical protein
MPGLVLAVLVLLVLDVAGAAWAVSSGVNSAAEAFSVLALARLRPLRRS